MTTFHAIRGDTWLEYLAIRQGPTVDDDPVDMTGWDVTLSITVDDVTVDYTDGDGLDITYATGDINVAIPPEDTALWGCDPSIKLVTIEPNTNKTTRLRGRIKVA